MVLSMCLLVYMCGWARLFCDMPRYLQTRRPIQASKAKIGRDKVRGETKVRIEIKLSLDGKVVGCQQCFDLTNANSVWTEVIFILQGFDN